MACIQSFRKRNPRKPDEKDKLQFCALTALQRSDCEKQTDGYSIPLCSPSFQDYSTWTRSLGLKYCFPGSKHLLSNSENSLPGKTRGVFGGVDPGVNSVARNRFAFPLVRDLLPDNLLPSQLFRVPKWNSALSSRWVPVLGRFLTAGSKYKRSSESSKKEL